MTKRRTIPGIGELFVLGDENDAHKEIPSPKQPTDQTEREHALDTTQSWIVEAPAGSGKTGLLIQRYLKLLAQPEVQQPEQVLAITFTLKAAGEIRERVLDQLERAAKGDAETSGGFAADTLRLGAAVLERDRHLGWGLLEHPSRLNLRTIDSICSEIAHGLPVLSGGGGLMPVEDAGPLHRLAAERTLLQLGGAATRLSDALSLVLLHRDGDLHRCRELLAEMLALRDQWGRLIPLDRESLEESFLDDTVLPQLERTLADAICTELLQVHNAFPQRLLERLSRLAAEMAHAEGYKGQPSPIAVCAGRYSSPEATATELEIWRALTHLLVNKQGQWRLRFNSNDVGFIIQKEHRAELTEVASSVRGQDHILEMLNRIAVLPPVKFPREQWKVAKALFHVLYRALAELQVVFAEREECDFTELSLLARSALHHGGASAETALRTDLQHMLVDEMQDTSTSQYELIQLLTQGWDGRSQTVFLVGDPKQSIYLFRQARVERFVRTMKELHLGDLRLGLLQLRSNFRSQPGLVGSFNDIFSRLFPQTINDDRPDEAPYVAAEAIRELPSPTRQNTMWHPQVISSESPDKSAGKAKLAQLEAREIRGIIEQWRARPLPPGRSTPWKIAVLVRNRSHLIQIVAELKRDDGFGSIPFRAVDIEPLSERPEVLDLFALTRALMHPADRVAWLSILRAPWCGLELADLHILCGEDDPQWDSYTIAELIHERGELLSERGRRLLERAAPLLMAVNRQLSRMPLTELVERTWRTLGGDTYLSAEEMTNAERYFHLLDETERHGITVDLETLSLRLGDLYAAPSSEPGAVDLMTIHGSKGLEWDVVLLPGLAKKSHGDSQRLLVWDELSSRDQGASEVILAPIIGKGRDSEALNDWLKSIHRRREEAECKRLFYVACTRAREELHLFATLKRNKDGSLRPAKGTLLAAAWPAAENHFVRSDSPSKPLIAPVVTIRQPAANLVLPAVAAEEGDSSEGAVLHRLAMDVTLPRRLPVIPWSELRTEPVTSAFDRPDGSFESRAFGSVIHAMLELLAGRIAIGDNAQELFGEIPHWQTRIGSLLRSHGLSPSASERLVVRVQQALQTTLSDPHGLWLLSSRKDAMSEHAMTAWGEVRSSVRLDRIFHAGETPLVGGEDYLWIIDFKTTNHTGAGVEEFLSAEQQKYAPQMETYTRIMRATTQAVKLRLGLYYPLLPKLIWWTPDVQASA